jgi:hypothetical protein
MRRGLMRGRVATHSVVVSWVALGLVLGGCSSSSSNRSSAGTSAASGPILSAVKPPTWAAGYWVGHGRTLDLAPNGVGLLVISLTGGGEGPFATIQLHVITAGPTQATLVIDSSDDPKTAVGSTHVVRYSPTADVITVDLDQQSQNFCGVTAAPGTCGA